MTSHDPHDDGLTAAERAALGQEYSRDHELTEADRRSFAEFAAEKKAEWNEDARAVYDAASEAFEFEVFTSEDFAQWRKAAIEKAEAESD